ncbi:MAG: hypothetical protein ACP5GS_01055 [Nitrososphaeria archaeon]
MRDVRGLGEAVNLNSFSDEIHGLPQRMTGFIYHFEFVTVLLA